MVLKLGKLEYHVTQYLSIPGSSTFYKIIIKKKIYIVLEFTKLEYSVNFFLLLTILKPGILEYCVACYSSLPSLSTT